MNGLEIWASFISMLLHLIRYFINIKLENYPHIVNQHCDESPCAYCRSSVNNHVAIKLGLAILTACLQLRVHICVAPVCFIEIKGII